jgi:hypothetical protein
MTTTFPEVKPGGWWISPADFVRWIDAGRPGGVRSIINGENFILTLITNHDSRYEADPEEAAWSDSAVQDYCRNEGRKVVRSIQSIRRILASLAERGFLENTEHGYRPAYPTLTFGPCPYWDRDLFERKWLNFAAAPVSKVEPMTAINKLAMINALLGDTFSDGARRLAIIERIVSGDEIGEASIAFIKEGRADVMRIIRMAEAPLAGAGQGTPAATGVAADAMATVTQLVDALVEDA